MSFDPREMTDKNTKPETKELSDADLDKVQGAGAKNLTGDETGFLLKGSLKGPQPKGMEKMDDDE